MTVFRSVMMCLLLALAVVQRSDADSPLPFSPRLDLNASGTTSALPPSNSVAHMASKGNDLWVGSSKGVAMSSNGGRSWDSFRGVPEFTTRGIFAIAIKDNTVWSANGFTKRVNESNVQTGAGYTFSLDYGATWAHVDQSKDARDDSLVAYGTNTVKFLPIVVDEQNVTFDVALSDSHVWIASWAGGLRRSSNNGQTWERIVLPSDSRNSISPTDSLGRYVIDPRQNNNFLGFSVYVQDDTTVWYGSAGGINKSPDGGRSWVKYSTLNQVSPILGNWVIAIAGQRIDSTKRIWATNWKADLDPREEFGISYTDDGGRIWKNFLFGIRAYDFAFRDSIAYVATNDGLYRTADGGMSWIRSGSIIDAATRQRVTSRTFFSVAVVGDTVFAGTGDGIVKTVDNSSNPFGTTWHVLRTYQPVGSTATTYAYPNPFSPDDEIVRLHYSTGGVPSSVTIEVFDFGMNRVRTVVNDAQRSGLAEYDEIWNGKDDNNTQVANGVYFYRVVVNNNEPVWGKVMVLQ